MIQIRKEDLEEVIENLIWAKNWIHHPIPMPLIDSISKLRAMIEQPEPTDEWIKCLPVNATMVRIGGAEFDYRPEVAHPDLSGGVIDGCFFNERGFRSLKATFYRRKPVEPVVVTKDCKLAGYCGTVLVPSEINPTKPFTVTFTQSQEAGK